MYNDDKDPTATLPPDGSPERIAYDAACRCDDTYGDYPWCPSCYPGEHAKYERRHLDPARVEALASRVGVTLTPWQRAALPHLLAMPRPVPLQDRAPRA